MFMHPTCKTLLCALRLDIDQAQRQYCQDEFDINDPDFYKFEGIYTNREQTNLKF